MDISAELLDRIISHLQNPAEAKRCSCGRGLRTVQCWDCFQYETSCPDCFIEHHYSNPFHWAQVWDAAQRFFVQTDYSDVLDSKGNTATIQLRHAGERQACPANKTVINFDIVHTNGIHSTKLCTCRCPGAPNKIVQLMDSQLFPATTSDPRTAFTFACLREFQMYNLQLKCTAFDYIHSLRRFTNDVFTYRKSPVSDYSYSVIIYLTLELERTRIRLS
jgi:hypothetical protein